MSVVYKKKYAKFLTRSAFRSRPKTERLDNILIMGQTAYKTMLQNTFLMMNSCCSQKMEVTSAPQIARLHIAFQESAGLIIMLMF